MITKQDKKNIFRIDQIAVKQNKTNDHLETLEDKIMNKIRL